MRSPGFPGRVASEKESRGPEVSAILGGAERGRGPARSNEEWLRALTGDGDDQAVALQDLRERILRGLLAYLKTHPPADLAHRTWADLAQLGQDCAQDAMLTILMKLDTFRGESRFTTWAYQVAFRALLGELRRKRWKEVSLERTKGGESLPVWPLEDTKALDPETAIQQEQVWTILRTIIENELTHRQQSVLRAIAFQGMPLDEVASWLGTNRDNVYKIIHDARKKLKRCLIERGLSREEILRSFEGSG
jgi:RNA polymerase sigma-70 factor, ECF subfamily